MSTSSGAMIATGIDGGSVSEGPWIGSGCANYSVGDVAPGDVFVVWVSGGPGPPDAQLLDLGDNEIASQWEYAGGGAYKLTVLGSAEMARILPGSMLAHRVPVGTSFELSVCG